MLKRIIARVIKKEPKILIQFYECEGFRVFFGNNKLEMTDK